MFFVFHPGAIFFQLTSECNDPSLYNIHELITSFIIIPIKYQHPDKSYVDKSYVDVDMYKIWPSYNLVIRKCSFNIGRGLGRNLSKCGNLS